MAARGRLSAPTLWVLLATPAAAREYPILIVGNPARAQ